MLLTLSSHPDFDKILEKYIPTKDLLTVRDTVFTLKTKARCFSFLPPLHLYQRYIIIIQIIFGGLVFRVLVRCLKTPSQPEEDAPYQAAVQSEPHLSPGSHSIRPTGILNINPYGSVNIKFCQSTRYNTFRMLCVQVYKQCDVLYHLQGI